VSSARWVRFAAWFLALSYGIGAPLTAYLEYASHTFSERFGYPATLIYLTCAVQLVCAVGVLVRPYARWAAVALTVITVGAIVSHLRIGSPLTAVPAIAYTAIQVWVALRSL
jgi:uncharacterized membrane protein YphA (DoxX/SURF4 family)